MKLGPLQEKWVETLEKYPERQTSEKLGILLSDGTYKCCCLGQALLCLLESRNKEPTYILGNLSDGAEGPDSVLTKDTFEALGLLSSIGRIKDITLNDNSSLAEANDNGVTWPEIAAFIRANPEAVFSKSV